MGLRAFFSDYSSNATIHGFLYILGDRVRGGAVARATWLILTVLSFMLGYNMIKMLYDSWQDVREQEPKGVERFALTPILSQEPVVITLETVSKRIQDVEFPTISVCKQGANVKQNLLK